MDSLWNSITAIFSTGTDWVLSLVLLVAFMLIVGAFLLYRRTGELKQPVLMAVLALIAVINVMIWTVPTSDGVRPIDQLQDNQNETAEAE